MNTKQTDALKLALKALEKSDSQNGYLTYITEIEALREALAEPVQQEPSRDERQCAASVGKFGKSCGSCHACLAAKATPPAQPAPVQQEPVAQLGDGVFWCDKCKSVQETTHHTSPSDRDVWCKGEAKWLQGPFYTSPPAQQEPVALDVTLEGDEARALYDLFGDDREDLSPVRLLVGDGHSGYGLYVALAEYQDEGAELIASIIPPAQQQEPFGYLYEGTAEHTRHKTVFQKTRAERLETRWWREIGPCYTFPQPAQRKALTNLEGLKLAYNHHWLTSLTLRDAYILGIRDAEAAHGIKGDK